MLACVGGVTTDIIFDMVAKIRKNTQISMVFMTYANVVYSYGTERYAQYVSGNTISVQKIPSCEQLQFVSL